jgi:hypothetical protein
MFEVFIFVVLLLCLVVDVAGNGVSMPKRLVKWFAAHECPKRLTRSR